MRMLLLLVVLAITALLVVKRMDTEPVSQPVSQGSTQPPAVPMRAQDVPAFKKQMDTFMDQAAKAQRRRLEQATQ